MKLKGSLACLLLFLLLGSGEASPLQGGEEDAGREVGESVGHGVGEALGHVVGEAVIHGVEEAIERGTGEKAGLGIREARDPHLGDALAHKLKEASHALENTGSEAGRQAENIIGHGVDPAHSSWQGTPGSNGAWGTHGQPPSRGHGIPGSQGGPGGPGDTRDHVFSGGSGGRFGANAQGGHRGPFNLGANPQGAATQPGSVRGSSNRNTECTNPPGSGGSSSNSEGSSSSGGSNGGSSHGGGSNGGSSHGGGSSGGSSGGSNGGSSSHGGGSGGGSSGSSGSSGGYNPNASSGSRVGSSGGNKPEGQGSGGEGEAVSGINTLNSQTSSEPFNFDTFWKNFKSKLGFINWDALNKGQAPPPSTRALLYFRRLWEDFKHNTPFLNWKVITEGEDVPSLQKRAGGAGQPGTGWQDAVAVTAKNYNYNQQGPPTALGGQYPAKTPAKGGVTVSSSASRMHPGLLQWVKFW
ncbi:dermokine isoform X2 [Cervus elaphus]|uniref:dermokine isoform X2 n=1 Tax=Cervus elaphus TaxID=9860 RepID=UPI001CC29962|nr:dermokine isoform X2 [Cervus elaphus]